MRAQILAAATLAPKPPLSLALVVDDDPVQRTVLRQVLIRSGCRVVEAENGQEAVEVFRQQPADIVLLDVMMPVMNGIEACQQIRRTPAGRRLPILITTALDDTESINRAFEAGATDFITKPLHLAVVRQRVIRLLQAKRAEEAIERAKLEWEATFDAVGELIVMTDETGRIVRCNRAVSRRLERSFAEIVGQPIRTLIFEGRDPRELAADADLPLGHLCGWFHVAQHTVSVHGQTYRAYLLRDITEQKTAEQRLRENEQRYRAVVEGQTEFICRWAPPDGVVTFANEAYARYFNRPLNTILGRSFVEFLSEPDQRMLRARIADLLTLFTPERPTQPPFEQHVTRSDGRAVWEQWTDRAIFDDEGRLLEVQTVGLDITARKLAEAAIQESERRYRGLFEDAPISLWEEDFSAVKQRLEALREQGVTDFAAYFAGHPEIVAECGALVQVLAVNRATLKQYAAEHMGQLLGSLAQILPAEAGSFFVEELICIAQGRTDFDWEGINYTLEGQRLFVRLHWSVVPGHEETLGRVLVSVLDITERKLMEDRLRESEERFRTLFEDAPIMYVRIQNKDGRPLITDANALFLQTLGYARNEVVGRQLGEFYSAASRDEWLAQGLNQTLPVTGFVVERQLLTRAGEIVETILHTTPERDAEGVVVGARAAYVDVTERKRLQDQMLAASKLADIGTLAAGVAHEINSPLQVITGLSQSWIQKLEQAGPLDVDRLHRNLDTIHRSGWRCAEIVRSLRTYAHAGGDKFEATDLNAVVRDGLLLIEHQLNKWSNINVTTEFAPALPPFACDRNQITQILINLLTNSRDAMPDGGAVRIRTAADAATERLLLEISDTGSGIPEAVRAKIFDPFFTTKPVGKGTGLGLSIVSGIVRAHGGEVSLDSGPGQGTTFRFYFPPAQSNTALDLKPQGVGRFDDSIGSYAAEPVVLAPNFGG